MRKMWFLLPSILLAILISGCGKTPDEKLQAKVPASVNSLCLLDGKAVIRTKLYQDNQKRILKELKEASLPEDVLQCRILFFGSTKEEWGGALIQSADKQVRKIYDRLMVEGRKENGKINHFKEFRNDKELRATAVIKGKKVMAVLYDDDLMLIAVQKTDPAFFNAAKPNPLFREIQWSNIILSSTVKVEMPQQGKSKESADMAMQMLPALQKLTVITLNIPFSVDDPEVNFRMIFQDDQAAGEMLAAVNMGIGFIAQSNNKEMADLTKIFLRKTEKNAVCISFHSKPVAEALEKMQQKKMKNAPANPAGAAKKAPATAEKTAVTAKPVSTEKPIPANGKNPIPPKTVPREKNN
ncbi:MAG: hypothetical protein J5858_00640 [Lentisphaeria bacterium]|nr:hypothetical protein [Lentisphaeria bacterium]